IRVRGWSSTSPNLRKSTRGTFGSAAARGSPVSMDFTHALTSECRIRFLCPVPFTRARSTPSSRASLRTEGLACALAKPASSIGGNARRSTAGAGRSAAGAAAGAASGAGWPGSACAPSGAGAGLSASGAVTSVSMSAMREPSETRSPTETSTDSIRPAAVAGTSIAAFSVSSVMSGSSTLTRSPGLTWTSMTSTSVKSPMSGTTSGCRCFVSREPARCSTRGSASPPDSVSAGFGAASAAAPPADSAACSSSTRKRPMTSPADTRSPTETVISSITPASVAGTSMEAFSVSSVMRPSSRCARAPAFTSTSMTSTSEKSPRSGTLISMLFATRTLRSDPHRSRLLGVDGVLLHRLRHQALVDHPILRERGDGVQRDVRTVHLEEAPQRLARVAATVAVGAERDVAPRHPFADLVRHRLHVVRGGDDRAAPLRQALLDVAPPGLGRRMQAVPARHLQRFPAELVEARDGPDVRGDPEILLQELGRGEDLAEDRAGTHELHPRLPFPALLEQVHPLENALLHALRHRRVRVVLVHHGDVIEDAFLLLDHAPQALADDHRDLVAVGR